MPKQIGVALGAATICVKPTRFDEPTLTIEESFSRDDSDRMLRLPGKYGVGADFIGDRKAHLVGCIDEEMICYCGEPLTVQQLLRMADHLEDLRLLGLDATVTVEKIDIGEVQS